LLLIKFGFSWKIFIHIPKTKFNESPSIGSNGDTCRQVEVKGPFRIYANVAKNGQRYENYLLWWQQGESSLPLCMLLPFPVTE